jgi:hypothetical protein
MLENSRADLVGPELLTELSIFAYAHDAMTSRRFDIGDVALIPISVILSLTATT